MVINMKKIEWNAYGWTVIQESDPEKHVLEIACLTDNGKVVEVRRRHNDGEEEKLTGKLDENYSLPMEFDEFKKAITKGKLKLK
jgi:hypothetical protein